MLNPKFNVYKTEWLDLVFENRNQLYGAYELRKSYSSTLIKAMLTASVFLVCLVTIPFAYQQFSSNEDAFIQRSSSDAVVKLTDVNMLPKKELPQSETPKAEKQASPVKLKTTKFVRLEVVHGVPEDDVVPTIQELSTSVISTQTVEGSTIATNTTIGGSDVEGQGEINTGTGNEILTTVENYPSFPGGVEKFYQYLSRNLRYPGEAVENNVMGKVIVSFVIEKNGDLSNIKVIKGIGYGCDEEAVRVLKNSPLWNPGEQNGQKVRVQYTMPIVFSLGI